MKVGDRVKYRKNPIQTYQIEREDKGYFGIRHKMKRLTGDGTFDLVTWYRPDELEVIE